MKFELILLYRMSCCILEQVVITAVGQHHEARGKTGRCFSYRALPNCPAAWECKWQGLWGRGRGRGAPRCTGTFSFSISSPRGCGASSSSELTAASHISIRPAAAAPSRACDSRALMGLSHSAQSGYSHLRRQTCANRCATGPSCWAATLVTGWP